MLKSLFVQNYAIIDQVTLDFTAGYNVITGETGAGKSILLGALNLVKGARADTRMLYDEKSKCIVEAIFVPSDDVLTFIKELGFLTSEDKKIAIRREISSTGKSRAFINESAAKLSDIKKVSERLLDIHNQFDTLSVTTPEYQLAMIDSIAGNSDLLSNYQREYHRLLETRAEVRRLEKSKLKSESDLEYVKFQLEELSRIPLDGLNKDDIESEYSTLSNAEEIKVLLSKMSQQLIESEQSVEVQIRESLREISRFTDTSPQLAEITEYLEGTLESLRDVDTIASRLTDNLDVSEERVLELKEVLDHVNFLENKHEVSTIQELIELRDDYARQTDGTYNIDELLKNAKVDLKNQLVETSKAAAKLSKSRKKVLKNTSEKLEGSLRELAMPNARILFTQEELEDYDITGKDTITLHFSSNKGIDPQPVSNVASGGELSRVALSAKSLIAELHSVATLIFDEIDTGISGAVAVKVGHILNDIAFSRQVICITHSPQVASIAQQHFLVQKSDTASRTITQVEKLTADKRILEIAKMLSSDPPSTYAIKNAKELLTTR